MVINELTNLEYLNCSDNQLTELNVDQNTKIKELLFSENFRLRKESIKGLEKLTQLISFKCDENLQLIQVLQQTNNSSQTEFIQLQQLNQKLTIQIQELQEKLASFEVLSLEEKIRIQNEYLERLKTNAKNNLNNNLLYDILEELLEDQDSFTQNSNDLIQQRIERNQRRLLNNSRLTEQEIDKLLRARINLTKREMQQTQEQQALIVIVSER